MTTHASPDEQWNTTQTGKCVLFVQLPDGTTIDVGQDRFRVPELFFTPSLLKAYGPVAEALARRVTGGLDAVMPLPGQMSKGWKGREGRLA